MAHGARDISQATRKVLGQVDLAAVKAAIDDLRTDFPHAYPRGRKFLDRLRTFAREAIEIERLAAAGERRALDRARRWVDGAMALRREALIANPLVNSRPILFVVRRQYRPDHHNTATLFQTGEVNTGSYQGGGALKTIDLSSNGQVTTLLEVPRAVCRDPEVHFSGTRIVFAMRRDINDNYHIYEIAADGTCLKQLTEAPDAADIDPLYMPDDSIVFSSTREPKYCMCNQHIMANLFRMQGDGTNIHQIGKSTLFEGHGALTPDGRILYDRWEYVDRNFGDAQGLWTVNADGTNHALYWGNNTNSPGAVLDARVLPDGGAVLCVFGSCHDRPWGALAIVDRRLGTDGRSPVRRTWPVDAIDLIGKGDFDTFKRVTPKYEDPYPLSDKYFLCSRMTGKGERMGIFLLDLFGNEICLHVEGQGCFDPMPLGPRPRPPATPSRRDFTGGEGTLYVMDVYQGTHMKGVERGTVKYLRVVQSPEKRFFTTPLWGGQGVERPGMNWHNFTNKRILGTVPVETDGSAYFTAPSDTFFFFQLLDEDGMMVQSMRSGTMLQSGETTGCVGCHENRRGAPPPLSQAIPLAWRRPPSRLNGWYGPARFFSYMAEVQPVFTKACARCHDYGNEAGESLNLAGDRDNTFNTSYIELWRKGFITCVGAGPAETLAPYAWGAHASKIVRVLREGHEDVRLTAEEFARIVTWIDLNGPYYPSYASAYPDNLGGRSPLSSAEIQRLEQLTGVPLAKLENYNRSLGAQICFERPALSPCLKRIPRPNEERYAEALAIIRRGTQRLDQTPRADMPGFKPCPVDQRRQEKYVMRLQAESRSREAIRSGKKASDRPTK